MVTWARRGLGWLCVIVMVWVAALPVLPMQAAPLVRTVILPPWFETSQEVPPSPVEPSLLRAMAASGDHPIRVIARFQTSTTFSSLVTDALESEDRLSARQALAAGLQAQLAQSRAPVEPLLASAEQSGTLLAQRDLWIVNGVALTARPALIRELAASPALAELRLDRWQQYVGETGLFGQNSVADLQSIVWGIDRVGAPGVWTTLAISGTGAVVAGMDSGVDWLHPDLGANYRGKLGRGLVNHYGSWFDAVSGGRYPYDDHGHGSHTLGTAVGGNGIGVAPGARWIGVKVLDSSGSGYDSDIHAGFQWLLAPEEDPALAPDVVLCSWGARNAGSTVFQMDLEALVAGGILPIFSAGNEGPYPSSLRSPASLPGVFAVGAIDPYDEIASFSSRGPSPWGEIKPYVVAPGVDIDSAAPGGIYTALDGTSMAAPHVAGIAALLRGISPTISSAAMGRVITETATPLTLTIPNNESGWGLVDAYAAALAVAHPGVISGTVAEVAGGGIPGAVVQAAPHGEAGRQAQATTGAEGAYRLALTPGIYDLQVAAFGYLPETYAMLQVITDTLQTLDFNLTALPVGTLRGRVTVSPAGTLVTGGLSIQVLGTPVTAMVNALGRYEVILPGGSYTVEVKGNGYRVAQAGVTVVVDETVTQNFLLDSAPTLLLVDDGPWYYASEIPYWRSALDTLRYAYDEVAIQSAPVTSESLDLSYDVVLWSSPEASPGLLSAGSVLTDYLDSGGRLLLSGQDVSFFDSGSGLYVFPQKYLLHQLAVAHLADNAPSRVLTGTGPFANMTITITGQGGADNQYVPDEIGVNDPEKAELFWYYEDGEGGGLGSHICTPHRALFFAFGYEAINDASSRAEVMARSLDWLVQSPPESGLVLTYDTAPRIALPGETVTHVLQLRHIGAAGGADTVQLSLSGGHWPVKLTPAEITLAPCTSQRLTITVTIPPTAAMDEDDFLLFTAHSSLFAEPLTTTLRTKTPAPLLLVDDDRWYAMEDRYKTTLAALNIPYDVWTTSILSPTVPNTGELLTTTLVQYPMLLWFTGYDWYLPVTEDEEGRLLHYLDGGGRLLLSSQDFLGETLRPLAQRMGVADWVPDREISTVSGVPDHPAGGPRSVTPLDYPFRNWSDSVEPAFAPDVSIVIRGDLGQPVALSAEGAQPEKWRTLFYAFPLEALPLEERTAAIERGLGWLSPLGKSTWEVTPTAPLPGALVTATLVVQNDASMPLAVVISHTLPAELDWVGNGSDGLIYTAASRNLSWDGTMAAGVSLNLSWVAKVSDTVAAGAHVTPVVTLALPAWAYAFQREDTLRVGGADLSLSGWLSPSGTTLPWRRDSTLTLGVHNAGPGDAPEGMVNLWMTAGLSPITVTVAPTLGTGVLLWSGPLGVGETQLLTVAVRPWIRESPLRLDALLSDGSGGRWERLLWLWGVPQTLYMPVTHRMWEAIP